MGNVTITRENEKTVIHLSGRIDSSNAPQVEEEMMKAEMNHHLGYEKSESSDSDDYRNGYKSKTVKSRFGKMEIEVPQNRRSTFEPQVVKKGQKT